MSELSCLPKFKKRWVKENSITSLSDIDSGVYLVFKETKKHLNHYQFNTIVIPQNILVGVEGLYFFEIFKSIKKIKAYHSQVKILAIRTKNKRHQVHITDERAEKLIKQKVFKKFNKFYKEKHISIRMKNLKNAESLINYCFDLSKNVNDDNISLVIQKKIGYKYYQNIIYT